MTEIEVLERALYIARIDNEMRNMNDEELVMVWLTNGCPDGCGLDDYIDFAINFTQEDLDDWTNLYVRLSVMDSE